MNPLLTLNHEGLVAIEEVVEVGLPDLVTWDSFLRVKDEGVTEIYDPIWQVADSANFCGYLTTDYLLI